MNEVKGVLQNDCEHLRGQLNDAYFANEQLKMKEKLLEKFNK